MPALFRSMLPRLFSLWLFSSQASNLFNYLAARQAGPHVVVGRDPLADERSEAAVVRVSAVGDGASVSSRQESSASALAEAGPSEQSPTHEFRRGVSRITRDIA